MPKKPASPRRSASTTKKGTSASKTSTRSKKSEPEDDEGDDLSESDVKLLAGLLIDSISSGELDGHLRKIDDALTARINKHNADEARAKSSSNKEKKISPAPKKSAPSASVTKPVKDKTYAIKDSLKKLAGAKVKFIRMKPGDDSKVMVEMVTDKPGFPKGKRVAIPLAAIEEVKKKGPRK